MSGRTKRLQICQLSLRESRCCFNHDNNGSQRMEVCYLMHLGSRFPAYLLYAAFRGHEQVSGNRRHAFHLLMHQRCIEWSS